MKVSVLIPVFLFAAFGHSLNAQILHTESFKVILDTSKVIKGSSMPSFRYRNVKKEFIEIENTADVSFRINNHALTIANKLEYTIYGKENLMSGGFVYLEYRNIQDNKIAFEPFMQMHWQEIRGMERKYAGGTNIRWRILIKPDIGIYAGLGALYEYECWNYSGVSEPSAVPSGAKSVEVKQFRGNSYLSVKKQFNDLFDLDVSIYYQPAIGGQSMSHRLASSSELTYNINQNFGLTVVYQNIYDSSPVVPIDKLFHDINLGITLSF